VLPFESARQLRKTISIPDPVEREAAIDHLVNRFQQAYPHLYRADLGTLTHSTGA
jgi:hypothetical protein